MVRKLRARKDEKSYKTSELINVRIVAETQAFMSSVWYGTYEHTSVWKKCSKLYYAETDYTICLVSTASVCSMFPWILIHKNLWDKR